MSRTILGVCNNIGVESSRNLESAEAKILDLNDVEYADADIDSDKENNNVSVANDEPIMTADETEKFLSSR